MNKPLGFDIRTINGVTGMRCGLEKSILSSECQSPQSFQISDSIDKIKKTFDSHPCKVLDRMTRTALQQSFFSLGSALQKCTYHVAFVNALVLAKLKNVTILHIQDTRKTHKSNESLRDIKRFTLAATAKNIDSY